MRPDFQNETSKFVKPLNRKIDMKEDCNRGIPTEREDSVLYTLPPRTNRFSSAVWSWVHSEHATLMRRSTVHILSLLAGFPVVTLALHGRRQLPLWFFTLAKIASKSANQTCTYLGSLGNMILNRGNPICCFAAQGDDETITCVFSGSNAAIFASVNAPLKEIFIKTQDN